MAVRRSRRRSGLSPGSIAGSRYGDYACAAQRLAGRPLTNGPTRAAAVRRRQDRQGVREEFAPARPVVQRRQGQAGWLRTAHRGSGPTEARPAGRSGGVQHSCGSDRPAPWSVEPPVVPGPQGRDDVASAALPARPGGSDPTSIVQSRSCPAAAGNRAVENFAFSRALARGGPERGSRARRRCAEKAEPPASQRAHGRCGGSQGRPSDPRTRSRPGEPKVDRGVTPSRPQGGTRPNRLLWSGGGVCGG